MTRTQSSNEINLHSPTRSSSNYVSRRQASGMWSQKTDASFRALNPNMKLLDLGIGNLHLRGMLTTNRNQLVLFGISLHPLEKSSRDILGISSFDLIISESTIGAAISPPLADCRLAPTLTDCLAACLTLCLCLIGTAAKALRKEVLVTSTMSKAGENIEENSEAKLQTSELEQDELSHEERESKRRKLDNEEESAEQIVSRQASPVPNHPKEEESLSAPEQPPANALTPSVPSPKQSSPKPDIIAAPEPTEVLNVLPAATIGPINGTDSETLEQPLGVSTGSPPPPAVKDEDLEIADGTVPEFAPAPVKDENEMIKKEDVFTPTAADSPAKEKDEVSWPKGKTKSAPALKSQTTKGKKAPAKKGKAKTKVRVTLQIGLLLWSMTLIK